MHSRWRSKSGRTTLALPPDMLAAIRRVARQGRCSAAEATRCLIEWGLESLETQHAADPVRDRRRVTSDQETKPILRPPTGLT